MYQANCSSCKEAISIVSEYRNCYYCGSSLDNLVVEALVQETRNEIALLENRRRFAFVTVPIMSLMALVLLREISLQLVSIPVMIRIWFFAVVVGCACMCIYEIRDARTSWEKQKELKVQINRIIG